MTHESNEITRLLIDWQAGKAEALEDLMPLVYSQLRLMAQGQMRSEGAVTLQPTALVHEAYMRLVNVEVQWQGRAHFFALTSTMMRRILVDEAKRKQAAKRGGGETFLLIEEIDVPLSTPPTANILALDRGLKELAELDPRKARVIELRSFAGLTIAECAEVLEISHATVERDLKMARAWLANQMGFGTDTDD